MSLLKNINIFRRSVTKLITKSIGHSQSSQNLKSIDKNTVTKILICRPNHRLGNQLLITPLVQEVSDIFPNAKIDLFVKGNLAPIIFRNYPNIDQIFRLPKKHFSQLFQYLSAWSSLKKKHYDLVINATSHSSSGNLATKFANSKYKYFGEEENEEVTGHMAKTTIYGLRNYLSKAGIASNNPIHSLDIKLSAGEMQTGKEALQQIVHTDNVVSLFTFATGDKIYSAEWWEELYTKLKNAFPTYAFIEILPVENISQLDFKIPSFYSKDIREMTALIANTSVFIASDSGIMHLGSASKTPTIGLFSVTDKNRYQPYNNNSLGINTNETDKDEIVKIVGEILAKN